MPVIFEKIFHENQNANIDTNKIQLKTTSVDFAPFFALCGCTFPLTSPSSARWYDALFPPCWAGFDDWRMV